MTGQDHVDDFLSAMAREGLEFRGQVIPDGILHRYHVEGEARGSQNGYYVLHLDSRPAGFFGTWHDGDGGEQRHGWRAAAGATPQTPAERAMIRAKIEADKLRRTAEQAARHDAAAAKARRRWIGTTLAPATHPYLVMKGVNPHGTHVGAWTADDGDKPVTIKDALIVPIYSAPRKLASLQAIFPSNDNRLNRSKDFLPGGRKRGCYFPIGISDGSEIKIAIICEGFATGATLHQATGLPVLVAFDAGNLRPVAEMARNRLGAGARIVIAADNDAWTTANPGVFHARAAADAVAGILAVPAFHDDTEKPTDFNDLAKLDGEAEVRAQIEAAIGPPVRVLAAA